MGQAREVRLTERNEREKSRAGHHISGRPALPHSSVPASPTTSIGESLPFTSTNSQRRGCDGG